MNGEQIPNTEVVVPEEELAPAEESPDILLEERKTAPTAPGFIKEFSKEASQEERDALAAQIREQRRGRDAHRAEQGELENEKTVLEQELNQLANTIEEYQGASFLGKIKDYLEYRKIKAEIAEKTAALSGVDASLSEKEEEIPQFAEAKKLITDFYAGERKKWAEAGYTPEDMQRYFSEENLSKLSLEDYALLMKRFPGEMVTHVTRQGIRDHAPMREHSAGLGEFHNSFVSMLADGRLRSSIGIALQEHTKEDAMVKFLKLDHIDDILPEVTWLSPREKALKMLEGDFYYSSSSSFDAYADRSSVHMAAERVLNSIYGGEQGNEIFIAYPSAYVATELLHSGDLTDRGGNEHNDKWIYTKDHEGMSLDAGIVFIPEDAPVDSQTGSRYKINERGLPTVPRQRIDEVLSARFNKKGFVQTFIQQLPWQMRQAPESERAGMAEEAFAEFGITDPDAQKALLNTKLIEGLAKLWGTGDEEKEKYEKTLSEYFHSNAVPFELAENTVSSREYWEKYFLEHPKHRPSKIVFYKGNPSDALNEWRENSGIVKKTNDRTYGVPENRVMRSDERLYQDRDRLASLARKIIDDRFPEQETREEIAA